MSKKKRKAKKSNEQNQKNEGKDESVRVCHGKYLIDKKTGEIYAMAAPGYYWPGYDNYTEPRVGPKGLYEDDE